MLAPFADILYFADTDWWRWHRNGIAKPKLGLSAADVRERFMNFAGQKCSIQQTGAQIEDSDVHILRNANFPTNGKGLSLDPECLVTGSNGGCQALNLGVLSGASMGILLGIDGGIAQDGATHFHGNHPVQEQSNFYPLMRAGFKAAAAAISRTGVKVYNATPGSLVQGFDHLALKDALVLASRL